jgi:hypothetical protein
MLKNKSNTATILRLPYYYSWLEIINIIFWGAIPFYVYIEEGIEGALISLPLVVVFILFASSLVMSQWVRR